VILVDTSVWVDHFRGNDPRLVEFLEQGQVLTHPFVIGELALGGLANRGEILTYLKELPEALVATDDEVLRLVEIETLAGTGIGYIDAHLLAATRLTGGARLWTRDRRLAEVSNRLSVGLS
jgi:predicted nucleic acid-binding protein